MSFPRVNFWNSLTHLLSSASAWQGSIEWIFKIILNEITKFPFFQSIDSRNTIYRISFPYAFFYHCLVSSNSLIQNYGESIVLPECFSSLVHFRFVSINRSFSQNLRRGVVPRGGKRGSKGKERLLDRRTIDPFFASCRVSPGSYTWYYTDPLEIRGL